ncbi:MAG: hypothetical protein ACI8PQ_003379, partial [Planctomycetota bacterium]
GSPRSCTYTGGSDNAARRFVGAERGVAVFQRAASPGDLWQVRSPCVGESWAGIGMLGPGIIGGILATVLLIHWRPRKAGRGAAGMVIGREGLASAGLGRVGVVALRDSLFRVVATGTSTGFATADLNQCPELARLLLRILIRILLRGLITTGACAGSSGSSECVCSFSGPGATWGSSPDPERSVLCAWATTSSRLPW